MSTVSAKGITRRYFGDFWNRKNLDILDENVAPNVTDHVGDITLSGHVSLKERIDALYRIYADPWFTVEDQIAEGDKVLVRWSFRGRHSGEFMGVAPTGTTIGITGMSLFRIEGSKITEIWLNADDLGELQQLGVLPAMQAQ